MWAISPISGASLNGMTKLLSDAEVAYHAEGWECEKRQRRMTRSGRDDLTPAAHRGHPDRPRPAAALS